MKKRTIELALSGGAARGIAHIGVIETLLEYDFEIKAIAGNSMGALVGAMFVLGKLDEFKEWLLGLDRRKLFTLIDFTLRGKGIIKGNKIYNALRTFVPDKNIEDLDIPFKAVSADLKNYKRVVFEKGSIYTAVRASTAIPGIFTPVETDGKILVDGGLVEPLPVGLLPGDKNNISVAVHVNSVLDLTPEMEEIIRKHTKNQKGKKKNKRVAKRFEKRFGALNVWNHSFQFITQRLTEIELECKQPHLVIRMPYKVANFFDFHKAEMLIEMGKFIARQSIENYLKNEK